mgnify:CR=1 FL=1
MCRSGDTQRSILEQTVKIPTDLDLYDRQFDVPEVEEEPLPTWGEILRDPETWPIVGVIVLFLVLNFTW